MKKRSLPVSIALTIITCGLYVLYWVYKITSSLKEATLARGLRCSKYLGPVCIALTVISLAVAPNLEEFAWVVLAGIGIVPYALMQDSLNDLIEHDSHNVIS